MRLLASAVCVRVRVRVFICMRCHKNCVPEYSLELDLKRIVRVLLCGCSSSTVTTTRFREFERRAPFSAFRRWGIRRRDATRRIDSRDSSPNPENRM